MCSDVGNCSYIRIEHDTVQQLPENDDHLYQNIITVDTASDQKLVMKLPHMLTITGGSCLLFMPRHTYFSVILRMFWYAGLRLLRFL